MDAKTKLSCWIFVLIILVMAFSMSRILANG